MNFLKTSLITVIMLILPVSAFPSGSGFMRISLIEGDVQIKTTDSDEWGLAYKNGPLTEGDQVWVPQGGRAELQLNNGSFLRLDEGSGLQILSMDNDNSQFYLSQGRAYILFNAPRGSVIQFDTPDASIRAFDRANFRADITDRYTDVAVYKGSVQTENNSGETRINAGEIISLGNDTNGEIATLGPADQWEDWNNGRNNILLAGRGGGDRYLPPELRGYSSDFDDNGRWVQVPEYGYVWSPTVFIGSDWAPYRKGRWVWRGGDYVWIGFEPWGWVPYHYGRWAFLAGRGWCWVPPVRGDVFWSPGYVGWVRTPEYVGWVPLAPGETYYGRGNFGRHSVNITNVNITQVNITNIYRNVHVNNGATIVSRSSFTGARPTMFNINGNDIQQRIFVKNNISIGTPQIKPTRESYFVSGRAVPAAKLPPQRIRSARIDDVKRSRPFIREPDKPVINRGDRPRKLDVIKVEKPRTPGREQPRIHEIMPYKDRPVLPDEKEGRGQRQIDGRPEKGGMDTHGIPSQHGVKPQISLPEGSQTGTIKRNGSQDQIFDRGRREMPQIAPPAKEKPRIAPLENRDQREPGNLDYDREKKRTPVIDSGVNITPPKPAERPKSLPPSYGIQGPQGTIPPATINKRNPMPARDKGEVINGEGQRNDRPRIQTPRPPAPVTPPARMERPQFQDLDKSMGKPPKESPIKEEKRKNQPAENEKGQAQEPGIKGEKKHVEPYGGNRGYQYQ